MSRSPSTIMAVIPPGERVSWTSPGSHTAAEPAGRTRTTPSAPGDLGRAREHDEQLPTTRRVAADHPARSQGDRHEVGVGADAERAHGEAAAAVRLDRAVREVGRGRGPARSGRPSGARVVGVGGRARRGWRPRRPGPAWTSSPARPSPRRACRRRPRRGRRGWRGSSRGGPPRSPRGPPRPACTGRRRPSPRARPPATSPATSPRSRPRSATSSRTMHDVEVLGGDLAELAHVLVAPVAGGGDDADPRRPGQVVRGLEGLADPVDEVAEHLHARARCGSSRRSR